MSIRKRRWRTNRGVKEAWIVDYIDQQGIRRQKTFAKKTGDDGAEEFAATVKVEKRGGVHVPDRATVTVREAGKKWIESCRQKELHRAVVQMYEGYLRNHMEPYFREMLISKITIPVVRNFQDWLLENGRSVDMVHRLTINLGAILSDAQERGLVARNAVVEMKRNQHKGRRKIQRRRKRKIGYGIDIPTREEIRSIIATVNCRWQPIIVTAIFTGMRISELRGLSWDTVDLERAEIHVVQRADQFNILGMPKSDAGQRTIPIPPLVVAILSQWKALCPRGEHNLVFPNRHGNIQCAGNIVKRGFKPTLIAAGIVREQALRDEEGRLVLAENGDPVLIKVSKYAGMHSLRHFFASWCINRIKDGGLELPPKLVQTRMGHANVSMTMDTYGHLFPTNDEAEALAAAEKALLDAT